MTAMSTGKSTKAFAALAGLALLLGGDASWAALPTPPPVTGARAGDWLSMLQEYVRQGAELLGLIFSVGGFLWTGWVALAELNEVRSGRKEMGGAILSAVLAAVVFLWISYLLLQAKGVIPGGAGGGGTVT